MLNKWLKIAPYVLMFFIVYETVAVLFLSNTTGESIVHSIAAIFNGYVLKYISDE